MLAGMVERVGRNELDLAPFIAVGCPGVIARDGRLERGGRNLPGNWEQEDFNQPDRLRAVIPCVGGLDTMIVMQNGVVVQGPTQVPFMRDVKHWGAMTTGTGLGNARFTTRQ